MEGETPALRRLRRKTTIETLWLYVLAVLAVEGPTYPYRIRKLIHERFGFKPSTVTLYTVVYRMEREGLLEKREGEYAPTERGIRALEEAVDYLENLVSGLRGCLGAARVVREPLTGPGVGPQATQRSSPPPQEENGRGEPGEK